MAYFSSLAKAISPFTPTPHPRPTTPQPRSLDRDSVSPTKRTETWLAEPTPKQDPNVPSPLRKLTTGRITKIRKTRDAKHKRNTLWGLPLFSTLFGHVQQEPIGNDLEGDTLVEEQDSNPATDDAGNDRDEEIAEQSPTHRTFSKRFFDYDDPRVKDWTVEEVWLFNKMQRRAYEPLLPGSWALDFPSFPDSLFSHDEKRVFINNTQSSITHACGSLNALIQSGPHCRDNIMCKLSQERPLRRGIQAYIKWSLFDSKLQRKSHIPLIAIAAAKPDESVESVVSRVTNKLYSLGRRYRDKWRHPDCKASDLEQIYTHALPTLYGFVVKSSVVAIVTCDSSAPRKPVRTLATFDFTELGKDVWHALAISIVVVRARNYLMRLDEEGELEKDKSGDSDPDA